MVPLYEHYCCSGNGYFKSLRSSPDSPLKL